MEEVEADLIFIDNQRKVKKEGNFSLHKNSIDITQNKLYALFIFTKFLIVFEQYVCNTATLLICSA